MTGNEWGRDVLEAIRAAERRGMEKAAELLDEGVPGFTVHGFIKPSRAAAYIRAKAAGKPWPPR